MGGVTITIEGCGKSGQFTIEGIRNVKVEGNRNVFVASVFKGDDDYSFVMDIGGVKNRIYITGYLYGDNVLTLVGDVIDKVMISNCVGSKVIINAPDLGIENEEGVLISISIMLDEGVETRALVNVVVGLGDVI